MKDIIKYFLTLALFLILTTIFVNAQSVDECMDCHSDEELTKAINDSTEISFILLLF